MGGYYLNPYTGQPELPLNEPPSAFPYAPAPQSPSSPMGAPPQGLTGPQNYNPQSAPSGNPPPYSPNLFPTQPWGQSDIPFTWDGNQGDLWQNQWQRQAIMGSRMMGELEQNQGQYNQAEAGYSNLVPNLYSDIWNNTNGGGGYTPQMQSDIVQREGLDRITGDLDSGYLTGGEQQGMMGDPYGAYNLSKPYQSDIASTAQQTGQQQLAALPYLQRQQQMAARGSNQAIGSLGGQQSNAARTSGRTLDSLGNEQNLAARQQNQNLGGLQGTEGGVQSRQRQMVGGLIGQQNAAQDYQLGNINQLGEDQSGAQGRQGQNISDLEGSQGNSLANMRAGYGAAINPGRLRSDPNYGSQVNDILGTGLGYVNDPNFQLRDDYLSKAGITDAEVNQFAASAGADASAPYQADRDRFYRDAVASGNVNPLGIAAKSMEFDRGAAGSAADAMNKARMNARLAQIQSLQGIQNTALGAASAHSGAGLNLINASTGALSDVERLRMGGEQDLSNRLIGANENLTQQDIDNARYASNMRTGMTQQDIDNARMMQAQRSGLSQQDIDNARYSTNVGMGVNQQDTANAQDLASRYQGTIQQGVANSQQLAQARLGNTQQGVQNSQYLTAQQLQNLQQGVQNQQYYTGQQTSLTGEAGNRNIGAYQYNANLGTGLASAADQAAAQRAAALATNRQSTSQFNTGVNLAANNALSQRYTAAYNPWLTAQQEGRQAATGQQGYFGGRAQDTSQGRLGIYNEQVQGGNQTLSGYTNWASVDKQPGKVAQAFNTAAQFF